jgi:dCMP deaminase
MPEYDFKSSNRMSKDAYYCMMARVASNRSTCFIRKYGCVIVKNDEIIATGYNGYPRGESNCTDTGICLHIGTHHNSGDYSTCGAVHAEQNAMLSASRRDMIGATMYLAGVELGEDMKSDRQIYGATPCPICMRMIKNSGIACVKNDNGVVWWRKEPECLQSQFQASV